MLNGDKSRFEDTEIVEAIERGILENKNKSYIRKLRELNKTFPDKGDGYTGYRRPQIEWEKTALFEWFVIEGSDKKPYLCGTATHGMANKCVIFDYKMNQIREDYFRNLHRHTENDFKGIVEHWVSYGKWGY